MRMPHLTDLRRRFASDSDPERPDALRPQDYVEAEDRPTADLLQSYARESLSPDEATLSRIGASVRAAFVAGTAVAVNVESRSPIGLRRRRVVAAMCAVAVLTLSSVGFAAAQSGPGQPFYRVRLNIEAANLPAPSSLDRLNTDLNRADQRLDEIVAAAAASDWNGAADATAAYIDVIASVYLPADAASRGRVAARLDTQLARLEQLRATSKGSETARLDSAIAAVCKILGIPVPPLPTVQPSNPSPHKATAAGTFRPASSAATPSNPDGDRDRGSPGWPVGSGSSPSGDPDGGPRRGHTSPTPRPTSSGSGASGPSRGGPWSPLLGANRRVAFAGARAAARGPQRGVATKW